MLKTLLTALLLCSALSLAEMSDWTPDDMRLTDYQGPPRIRLSADVGLGWRMGSIPAGLNKPMHDYLYGLQVETSFSGEAAFFFSRYFGAGLDAGRISLSNYADNAVLADPETGALLGMGPLTEVITLKTIGPSLIGVFLLGNGDKLILLSVAPVAVFFSDAMTLLEREVSITGSGYACKFGIAFDYRILDHLGLGLGFNYMMGSIKGLKLDGKSGILKKEEAITSFLFHPGVKIYF